MRIPCASPPPKRRGPPSDAKLPKFPNPAVRIYIYIYIYTSVNPCIYMHGVE